jgi:PemK-like, MazF-like toxin of type II toxin-antitoxin system
MAPDSRSFLGRLFTAPFRFLRRKDKGPASAHAAVGRYPGDFSGTVAPRYSPAPDGRPDPGEIVWAWVPYEEDHGQGKDRPVLLIGKDGPWLLGLMLTSKDHDNGHRRADYVDVGAGAWDVRRRPSEVRISRIVRIDPAHIRREGAVLGKAAFRKVADALAVRQAAGRVPPRR